jgi:hypothetical protein
MHTPVFQLGDRVRLRVTVIRRRAGSVVVRLPAGSCGTIWMGIAMAPETYFVQFDDLLFARVITARDLERIAG